MTAIKKKEINSIKVMVDIFAKLGKWFKPNQEKEIKVIGFYTHTNDLFLYNSWDDTFDNFLKVDLTENVFKYENNSMFHAETCMEIEGNVGELQELSLFI
jgi:hypothetical protein